MATDAAAVISAQAPFAELAARLANKAGAIARAHAASIAQQRRDDARHWRDARLIWPLFGQG
jgi:hypothetical protein